MPASKTRKKTTKTASSRKLMTVADLREKLLAKQNRKSIIILGAVIIVGVLLFVGRSLFVAATVNGEPISRISVVSELESQNGKATLDRIITKKLVLQEAVKKNVTVSQDDINKEYQRIEKQFKDQGQDLNQLLDAQGISKSQFEEEVKIQLLVEKLLGDQVKVTDEEFNQFLEQNKDLLENEENQEQAKLQYRQQLEQQKLAQKYQEWVASLKQNAKIQTLVNY